MASKLCHINSAKLVTRQCSSSGEMQTRIPVEPLRLKRFQDSTVGLAGKLIISFDMVVSQLLPLVQTVDNAIESSQQDEFFCRYDLTLKNWVVKTPC